MATDYSRYQYIKIEKDNGLCTDTQSSGLAQLNPSLMHHGGAVDGLAIAWAVRQVGRER